MWLSWLSLWPGLHKELAELKLKITTAHRLISMLLTGYLQECKFALYRLVGGMVLVNTQIRPLCRKCRDLFPDNTSNENF